MLFRYLGFKTARAFTLIEVLVGVAITGILVAAIAVPSLYAYKQSRASAAEINAQAMEAAMAAYVDKNPFSTNTYITGRDLSPYFPAKTIPEAPAGYVYVQNGTILGTTSEALKEKELYFDTAISCEEITP